MKRQEDKESCFSATEENVPFIWKAIDGYVSMAAFMSTSFQLSAGPKEPSCPSLATSSLLVLTVAQAFHGSRDGDTIPKMYQEKCYDIWEAKAFQPLTVLPFALRLSNGIHLAFPLQATPGSRGHASEKDFGPMLPHIFTSTSTTDS